MTLLSLLRRVFRFAQPPREALYEAMVAKTAPGLPAVPPVMKHKENNGLSEELGQLSAPSCPTANTKENNNLENYGAVSAPRGLPALFDRFPVLVERLMRDEGGLSDRPPSHDPGGRTNYGVTQRAYSRWLTTHGFPVQDVGSITLAEARELYRENYWLPVRGPELPVGLDWCVFTACAMSGPGRATRLLQEAVGAKVDGIPGGKTLAAAYALPYRVAIDRFCGVYQDYLRGLKNFKHNAGWIPRINRVCRQAIADAEGRAS